MNTKNIEKGFYYHNKHDVNGPINNYAYEVLGVSKHTEEEGVLLVIYKPLYKSDFIGNADFYARPIEMFFDTVSRGEREIPRFTKITDQKVIDELKTIKSKINK